MGKIANLGASLKVASGFKKQLRFQFLGLPFGNVQVIYR